MPRRLGLSRRKRFSAGPVRARLASSRICTVNTQCSLFSPPTTSRVAATIPTDCKPAHFCSTEGTQMGREAGRWGRAGEPARSPTTAVTILNWRTRDHTKRALHPAECSDATGLRRRARRALEGPTAGCEQTARPMVGEVAGAQSPAADPITKFEPIISISVARS